MMPRQLFTYVSEEMTASFIRESKKSTAHRKMCALCMKMYVLSDDWCAQLLVGALLLYIGGRE
jgi:hypothetical protein